MINFDITHKDLKSMFKYFEAINKENSIQSILRKEEGKKRGRKSIAYSVISQLKEKDFNDIAIYVGIALSKLNIKPKWSTDEIIGVLENNNFIDDKFIPMLKNNYLQDKNLSQSEMKDLASEIQKNILNNERETIDNVRNVLKNQKRHKNVIFAHQFKENQLLSIRNSIIQSLKILKDTIEDFDINNFLNHNPENEFTYSFFNKLMGGKSFNADTISLFAEVSYVLQSLEQVGDKEITSDAGKAKLASWIDTLKKVKNIFSKLSEKAIVWPQADNPINDIESLKQYFLSIEDTRSKNERMISQYKKRKNFSDKQKEEENITITQFDEKSFKKIINSTAKELAQDKSLIGTEQKDLIKLLNDKVEKMVEANDDLKQYVKLNYDDYISEMVGLIYSRMKSSKALMGRPSNIRSEE